jgi:hypothetical protein
LVDPNLLAEMYQVPGDRDEGYGLGIALARAGDVPLRGHGGGGFGFLADIYWAPQTELGVVVLTNSTSHPLQWQLASGIFRDLVPAFPPDGPWNRDYVIRANGVPDGTARLRKENELLYFDHWHGGTVRLHEHRPGLYVSENGEMLDLTRTPPTYANVRLHQH